MRTNADALGSWSGEWGWPNEERPRRPARPALSQCWRRHNSAAACMESPRTRTAGGCCLEQRRDPQLRRFDPLGLHDR